MPIVLTRATKLEARYKALGGSEHCSACRFYMPQGTCGRIIGPVSPEGWCKYYSREFVQRWQPGSAGGNAAALPPGASLDLSFMSPGTLDPRISFARASTGTYTDSTGTMQTAAINAPRWDYDPVTLQLRGLLLEDQRTNGVRNSTMQGAVVAGAIPTNWVVTTVAGITVAVAGLGTDNGLSYIDFSFSGTASTSGSVTVAADSTTQIAAVTGQAWAASCYIKLVSGSVVGTLSSGYSGRGAGGAFLSDYLAPVTPSSASLATQRWLQTNTSGVGGIAFVQPKPVVLALTNGQVINFTLRAAGPQLEQGGFATSFIPTTSAAVTRSIEVCSMPTAAWFNPAASSLFAEYMMTTAIGVAAAGCDVCALSDGTANNKMAIRGLNAASPNSLFLSTVSGASVVSASQGPLTSGVAAKYAAMWNGTAPRGVLNGGTVLGYSQALPGGVNLLTFGNQIPAGLSPLNGYVRRVSYWPRVLSDAEMQQVTT